MSALPPPLPPVQPVPVLPAKPVWSMIVGAISTAFGAFALVSILWSFAIPQTGATAQMMAAFHDWYQRYMLVSSVVGCPVAILLLAAGILTLYRWRLGRVLHLLYGVVGGILCIVNASILLTAASQVSGPPAVQLAIKAASVAALMGLAYPVFLLVWFLRGSIAQQVRAWR